MVTALAFLRGVPSWAWVAVAAVLLVVGAYFKGSSDKNSEWETRLAIAEQEAKLAAEKAMREADSEAEKRAIAHAATQSTLVKVINDAERDNRNPLDSLLSSLPEAD